MISPFYSSSRERARDYPFYRLRLLFTLKATVSLFYKAKQSAWRWSEESSINTHEHDAGHSINETADHFIKHICFPFLDAFWGVTHQPTQQWSMTEWYEQIKVIGFGSSPLTSLFTPLHMFLNGCAPPPRWAGAGLPPSYAAFISLAELGGSCNKPLSTLPFSYVFMKASRLSRSGPSSTTQSDLLVCLLWPLTDLIGISCLRNSTFYPLVG